MANNRLYIVNTKEKEYLMIAKHFGGWYQWTHGEILDNFLQSIIEDGHEQTKIILIDEHHPEWKK